MDDSQYEIVPPATPSRSILEGEIPGSMEYDIVSPDGQHHIVPSAGQSEVLTRAQKKLAGLQLLRRLLSQSKNQRLADVQVANKTKKRRAKNKVAKASRKKNRR